MQILNNAFVTHSGIFRVIKDFSLMDIEKVSYHRLYLPFCDIFYDVICDFYLKREEKDPIFVDAM